MAEPRTWNAVEALEGCYLDAELFDAGCAPADVEYITWCAQDKQYGVRVNGTLRVSSWWSPMSTWNDCMPLAWQYRISLSVAPALNTWFVWASGLHGAPLLSATTEAEARHQLCRLALYCALQKKEDMP